MPFKVSIKYYALPNEIAEKYLFFYISDKSFIHKSEAVKYRDEMFYSIKNEIFHENGRWKIRLFMYTLPNIIYSSFIKNKTMAIFNTKEQAEKYVNKNLSVYLYSIKYTNKTSDFAAIQHL